MSIRENITHPGIIDDLNENSVFVRILSMSACTTCSAKGMCNISEVEEKIVEVNREEERPFFVGQEVLVCMKNSQGGKAVFLGYVLPFILVMAVLMLVLFISDNQGLAGLMAIAVLVPYYWMLYMFRDRLKRTFSFSIL